MATIKCRISRDEFYLGSICLMPAPMRIVLTEEEDRTLLELRVAASVPYRTRDRAHMLWLNAQGWTVPAIAEIFDCHEQYGKSYD